MDALQLAQPIHNSDARQFWKLKLSTTSRRGCPRLNSVKMFFAANEQGAVADRVGSQRPFAQRVACQLLKFPAGLDHDAQTLLVLDVNSAVRVQRRRRTTAANSLLPVHLAGLSVQTARKSRVGNQ